LLALLVLSLASLGATILYVSPVLVVAAALFAQVTEAKSKLSWKYSRWLALSAALVLLVMTSLQAVSDWHTSNATKAGMAHQYEEAHEQLAEAQKLPFQHASLLFLQGRILLEEKKFQEAKEFLQQASQLFPHPEVFRPLAYVCLQTADLELLTQVLSQWEVYAPNDKLIEKFKDFR
jgi:Flp pilus assembly protein TadD